MLLIYNHLYFDKVYLNLYIFIKSCILIFKFSELRISTKISRKKESKKMQRKEKMLEKNGASLLPSHRLFKVFTIWRQWNGVRCLQSMTHLKFAIRTTQIFH